MLKSAEYIILAYLLQVHFPWETMVLVDFKAQLLVFSDHQPY